MPAGQARAVPDRWRGARTLGQADGAGAGRGGAGAGGGRGAARVLSRHRQLPDQSTGVGPCHSAAACRRVISEREPNDVRCSSAPSKSAPAGRTDELKCLASVSRPNASRRFSHCDTFPGNTAAKNAGGELAERGLLTTRGEDQGCPERDFSDAGVDHGGVHRERNQSEHLRAKLAAEKGQMADAGGHQHRAERDPRGPLQPGGRRGLERAIRCIRGYTQRDLHVAAAAWRNATGYSLSSNSIRDHRQTMFHSNRASRRQPRPDPRPGRPREQPEGRQRRDPQAAADGVHRRLGIGQVVAGVRHHRGGVAAADQRDLQRVRAGIHADAGPARGRRPGRADDRDHRRPGADGRQLPLDGRHGDRRQRDAAGAVQPPRQAAHRLVQRLLLQRPVGPRRSGRSRSRRAASKTEKRDVHRHRRHVPAMRGHGIGHRHRPVPALRRQQVAQRGCAHDPRLHAPTAGTVRIFSGCGLLRPGQADPQVHQEGAPRLPLQGADQGQGRRASTSPTRA